LGVADVVVGLAVVVVVAGVVAGTVVVGLIEVVVAGVVVVVVVFPQATRASIATIIIANTMNKPFFTFYPPVLILFRLLPEWLSVKNVSSLISVEFAIFLLSAFFV
jgi:hypothetical protein